jgi:Fe-Mn family superoxide dismutase
MRYEVTPIHCRPWTLNGISLKLIESHFENNYGGALRKLNAISAQLDALDYATTPPWQVAGMKREELAALNSTLLHELYFACLSQSDGKPTPALVEALTRDFGSVDRWRAQFLSMAMALAGGSGWVLLTWVPRDNRLVNQFATDHSQAIAGGIPILALDMYEHAFHIDFGANAKAYIEAFMRNLDWKSVEARFLQAAQVAPPPALEQPEFAGIPAVGPEEVKAMLDAGQKVQIVDARPSFYVSRTQDIMEGATWRDPERVQDWIGELSKTDPVVVFCVYGFHVGCRTAGALREAGFDAKFMKGGHVAWKAMGGKTKLFA